MDSVLLRSVELAGKRIELLVACGVRHCFAPHVHETYSIGVMESGATSVLCRGVESIASRNDIIAFAPGEAHSSGPPPTERSWSYRMLYLPAALFNDAEAQSEVLDFRAAVIADPGLASGLLGAHRALICGREEAAEELLTVATHKLVKRHCHKRRPFYDAKSSRSAAAAAAREYIHAHLTVPLRLSSLAQVANVGRYQLIRLFRRVYGVSPYAYVKQHRVIYAQGLLRAGEPIASAALLAGFSDQSHFCRAFRAALGMTPGAYVRALRSR